MWFYRISLPHRFSGAAPCPKYDTRRGVMLSLHAGILAYLRILFFFATIYQSSNLYVVVANQWERMLLPRYVCRLVSSNLSLEWNCTSRHLATLPK